MDGGASWRLANVGLPVVGQGGQTAGATALAQDPRDPAVLYAARGGEGILKSLDGGLSYVAGFGTTDEIRGFVFDPADADAVYAATDFGVLFSGDAGGTFEPRNTGLGGFDVRELKFVGATLLAATDRGLYRSDNGGGNWSPVDAAGLTEQDLRALEVTADGSLYAAARTELNRSLLGDAFIVELAPDGSLAWASYFGGGGVDAGLGIAAVGGGGFCVTGETSSTEFFPLRNAVQSELAGATDAFVARFAADRSLVYSTYLGGSDAEASFQSSNGNDFRIESFGAVAALPDGSVDFPTTGDAFRREPLSGLLLSTDGGTTFMPFNNGLPAYSVYELGVAPSATNRIYAALSGGNYLRTEALARGMFRSDDGGASWLEINNGLSSPMVNAIAIDPTNEDTVLAATGVTDFVAQTASGSVFRSTDGGVSWADAAGGLPAGLRFDVLAVAPGGGTVLVGGNDNRGVDAVPRLFRSNDGGANWAAATTGLGDGVPTSVVFDPADPAIIYVALRGRTDGSFPDPTYFPGGVFKSTDGGATWAAMNGNIVGRPEETIKSVENLAVDPIEAETLYVLASFETGTLGQVVALRSTDGGASWAVGGDLPSQSVRFNRLAVSATGGRLHAVTRDWVFVSPDGGTTWSELGITGHEGYEYNGAITDPVDPDKVYLFTEGSSGGGIRDAFLAKIAPDGSALTFSSLLGGARSDLGQGVTATGTDRAAVVGMTLSYDIPTTPGGFRHSFSGGTGIAVGASRLSVFSDAFVISADLSGTASETGNVVIFRAPPVFVDAEEVTPVVSEVTFDSGNIPAPISQAEVDAALAGANPGERVLVQNIVERVEDDTRIDETIEMIETNGAVFGVDYTGNPDDPETWVALTQADVMVNITTTIERTLLFTQTTTTYFVIAPGLPNGADLAVSKTAAPDPVIVGSELTYTITIQNNGPEVATGVEVSDSLPEMADFVSATGGVQPASGIVTFTVEDLAVGATNVFQIVVRPRTAGPAALTNVVSVTAVETDPVGTNNSATVITSVFSSDSDPNFGLLLILSIHVNADDSVTIRFLSEPGMIYHLEYSDDLSDFIRTTPPIAATSFVSEITDSGPPRTPGAPSGENRRFYRIAEDG